MDYEQMAMNSKKIKEMIAEQAGISPGIVSDDNLHEVDKALDGAAKVSNSGADPTTMPIQDLKKLATGEKDKSDADELSNQHKIAMAITAIAPALIGYAAQGAEGGAIGAQVGGKALTDYNKAMDYKQKRAEDIASKKADQAIASRKAGAEERKAATDERFKDRELNLKEMEIKGKNLEKGMQEKKDKRDLEVKLAENFLSNHMVKDHQDATVGMQKIREATADAPDGQKKNQYDDVALVFNFMKVLDPGSVVREGEYKTAQNNAGMLEKMGVQIDKLKSGAQLSPNQRKAILDAAERQFSASQQKYDTLVGSMEKVASKYGLDPENVTRNFGSGDGHNMPVQKKADVKKSSAPGMGILNEANAAEQPAKPDFKSWSVKDLKKYVGE